MFYLKSAGLKYQYIMWSIKYFMKCQKSVKFINIVNTKYFLYFKTNLIICSISFYVSIVFTLSQKSHFFYSIQDDDTLR